MVAVEDLTAHRMAAYVRYVAACHATKCRDCDDHVDVWKFRHWLRRRDVLGLAKALRPHVYCTRHMGTALEHALDLAAQELGWRRDQ